MASHAESGPSPNRKKGFLNAWKKFNTVSAAVLASAGIIFEQPLLLGLAAIDVAQSIGIGALEKWRQRRKSAKSVGSSALAGAHA